MRKFGILFLMLSLFVFGACSNQEEELESFDVGFAGPGEDCRFNEGNCEINVVFDGNGSATVVSNCAGSPPTSVVRSELAGNLICFFRETNPSGTSLVIEVPFEATGYDIENLNIKTFNVSLEDIPDAFLATTSSAGIAAPGTCLFEHSDGTVWSVRNPLGEGASITIYDPSNGRYYRSDVTDAMAIAVCDQNS